MSKAVKVILLVPAVLLVLVVGALTVVTQLLTPDRLTRYVNRELSRELAADVTAHNVRFTFWSSFPHLHLEMDSIRVESRALDSLPPTQRAKLPAGCSFLLSSGRFEGAVNMRELLRNRIVLRNVSADSLRLNLVRVSDSVANWDIVPPSKSEGIPDFSFNSIKLTHPRAIHFRDLDRKLDVEVSLSRMQLTRLGHADDYNVSITGVADVDINDRAYLDRFPFGLDGKVSVGFKPFRLHTDSYAVRLGNTDGKVDVNIELENGPRINRFNYSMNYFDLNGLLALLPRAQIPFLQGLDADLSIRGDAQITTPYMLDSDRLPSGTLSVSIPDGSLSYDNPRYGDYSIRGVSLKCRLEFDGKNPSASTLYVDNLTLRDRGTDLSLEGVVHDIGRDPEVEANVQGKATMSELATMFPAMAGLKPGGEFESEMGVRFRMSDLRDGRLDNVKMTGRLDLDHLDMQLPDGAGRIRADNLRFAANADAGEIAHLAFTDPSFRMALTAGNLLYSGPTAQAEANGVSMTLGASRNGSASLQRLPFLMPYDLQGSISALDVKSIADTARVSISDVGITGAMTTNRRHGGRVSDFKLNVKGSKVTARHGHTTLAVEIPSVSLTGMHSDKRVLTADYRSPASWRPGKVKAPMIYTTRPVLQVKAFDRMRRIMEHWGFRMRFRGSGGELLTPAYPVMNRLTGIDVEASLDSVIVRQLGIHSQRSDGRIAGSVSNVRQFLLSRTPAPLRFRFFADFDTIQLNQLCGAYRHGVSLTKGAGAFERMLHDTIMSRADSTALLVPRNLNIRVGVNIGQIQYGDINYNDCRGTLSALGGVLNLDSVRVNTGFVDFAGNLRYDTSDLQSMAMALNLDMDKLDVTRFFYYFHTMSLMVPQLTNIRGMFDINTSVSSRIYPTMYAMTPSVAARVRLNGHDVSVHQTPEMRRYTRHVLPDGPIRIGDVRMHVSLFDNMVTMYPFDIDVDKIRLRVQGRNSLNGDMYYHVAVREWMLPIPFGINIKGSFRHPVFRLGGLSWHDSYDTEVANNIDTPSDVNLLYEAKHIVLEFIQKAAEADKTPASEFLSF